MTGNQERIRELRSLLIDMDTDLRGLERLFDTMATEQARYVAEAPQDDIVVWGLAAWLHHLYTGVESLLSRIAQVLDGYTTQAEDWHRRLLLNMSNPLEHVRPAVLSPKTFAWLDELRRFRHLFRHAYGAELDGMRIKELVLGALAMRSDLRCDFTRTKTFVTQMLASHDETVT